MIKPQVEKFETREAREARYAELKEPREFQTGSGATVKVPRVRGLARLTDCGPGGSVVWLVTYSF
jgi:hypothetical protein